MHRHCPAHWPSYWVTWPRHRLSSRGAVTLGAAVSESELRPVSGELLVGTASLPFREGLWRLCFLQWLLPCHARSAETG